MASITAHPEPVSVPEEDDATAPAFRGDIWDSEKGTFTEKLEEGIPILLHVKIGTLEPGSIRLDVEAKKIVVKTDRDGWCSFCHCHTRRYDLRSGELEPVPHRAQTRKLNRSISVVNDSDRRKTNSMLNRSLSLLRRYPKSESIDITFLTPEDEEMFRTWVQRLVIDDIKVFRQSSKEITTALQGRRPSDTSNSGLITAGLDSETPPPWVEASSPNNDIASLRRLSAAAPVHPTSRRPEYGVARGGETYLEHPHGRLLSPEHDAFFDSAKGATDNKRGSFFSTSGGSVDVGGAGGGIGSGGGGKDVYEYESSCGSSSAATADESSFWTWKEPPVLRKMDSSPSWIRGSLPTGGAQRSPSLMNARGESNSMPSLTKGASEAPHGAAAAVGSPPLNVAMSRSKSEYPNRSQRRPQLRESGISKSSDFWDPLGLLSELTPKASGPPEAKSSLKNLSSPAPWIDSDEKNGDTE